MGKTLRGGVNLTVQTCFVMATFRHIPKYDTQYSETYISIDMITDAMNARFDARTAALCSAQGRTSDLAATATSGRRISKRSTTLTTPHDARHTLARQRRPLFPVANVPRLRLRLETPGRPYNIPIRTPTRCPSITSATSSSCSPARAG